MRTAGKTHQQIADKVAVSRSAVSEHLQKSLSPTLRKKDRQHRTRANPFDLVWDVVVEFLQTNPGLKVKTIFRELQKQNPGVFQDGQRRSLERRVRMWKLENGPSKEIYFEQIHTPGRLAASDYTKMGKLNITIQKKPFDHMLYHFVLTYSNWEAVTICYGESFESLSEGFQNALWELGGVPEKHRTDNLGAAVINLGGDKGEMTERFKGLLDHYGLDRSKIQPGKANENGDVEKSNDLLKKAIDQQLMLRGSRDFKDQDEYEAFLRQLLSELNSGRSERLEEELAQLKPLPSKRLDASTKFKPTVSKHSTITLNKSIYSVHSRLKGLVPEVRQYSSTIEVWYGGKLLDIMPRMIGTGSQIDYRHIIDSLVRKPGAFADWKYHAEMFPTSHYRETYDYFLEHCPAKASSEYLKILHLAASGLESEINLALKNMLGSQIPPSLFALVDQLTTPELPCALDVEIITPELSVYDNLIKVEFAHEQ